MITPDDDGENERKPSIRMLQTANNTLIAILLSLYSFPLHVILNVPTMISITNQRHRVRFEQVHENQ